MTTTTRVEMTAMTKGERREMRKVARLVGPVETRKLIDWHRAQYGEVSGASAREYHQAAVAVLESVLFAGR